MVERDAVLCGEAAVPEVADGGADGAVVAVDDEDGQPAVDRVEGVGQPDDPGADDQDVDAGRQGGELRGGHEA